MSAATPVTGQAVNENFKGEVLDPSVFNKNWVRLAAIGVAIAASARGTEYLSVRTAAFLHLSSFAVVFGMLAWVSTTLSRICTCSLSLRMTQLEVSQCLMCLLCSRREVAEISKNVKLIWGFHVYTIPLLVNRHLYVCKSCSNPEEADLDNLATLTSSICWLCQESEDCLPHRSAKHWAMIQWYSCSLKIHSGWAVSDRRNISLKGNICCTWLQYDNIVLFCYQEELQSQYYAFYLQVTFVAGLVQFKNLPRQQFGRLQSKLFPIYFLISIVTLALQIGTLKFALPGGLQPQQARSLGMACLLQQRDLQ